MALGADTARAASERIAERLEPLLARHHRVALFWPMLERREIDLRALAASLRDLGKDVYLPCVADGSPENGPLFRRFEAPETLVPHRLGFLQPGGSAPVATHLDFIVAPALAATRKGQRLGYGAGHYDRALAAFDRAETAAVVYGAELLDGLPTEAHDRRVDWVVSEERVSGPT
jgi:5-formyltetrahydrofolate cyclo-ligase